jgi:hypothetical protein
MLGLRELAMVATVVLVLYGRTSVLRSQRFQTIWPWIAPVRRKPGRTGPNTGPSPDRPTGRAGAGAGAAFASQTPDEAGPRGPGLFQLEGNRLFWFLTILAATAVATAIVTRMLILHGAVGTSVGH